MKTLWYIFYQLTLPLFRVTLSLASIFNSKIRKALRVRKNLFEELNEKIMTLDASRKNVLFQCSSLGEFEEAKPIIEELDKTNTFNFIISFSSPSGYENAKLDFDIASRIIKTYLPFDFKWNIKKFLTIINPYTAIFIKYDLWLNYLDELSKRNIRTLLVNASFNEYSFKWKFFLTGSFYKVMLNYFDTIVTKDEDDRVCIKKLVSSKIKVESYGDTKLERISKAIENAKTKDLLNIDVLKNKKVLVIGSSWEEDEKILFPVINKINSNGHIEEYRLLSILAPHEPNEKNLLEIEEEIRKEYPSIRPIRYSQIDNYKDENLVIVDSIGKLQTLYKYADLAYVGGGLQTGMHNVLEPAGYGIPVIFGNEKLSEDGDMLIKVGGGIGVDSSKSLYRNLLTILNKSELKGTIGIKSSSVFKMRMDTSKNIAKLITV